MQLPVDAGSFPDCSDLCAEMSSVSEKLYVQNERIYSAEYQDIWPVILMTFLRSPVWYTVGNRSKKEAK